MVGWGGTLLKQASQLIASDFNPISPIYSIDPCSYVESICQFKRKPTLFQMPKRRIQGVDGDASSQLRSKRHRSTTQHGFDGVLDNGTKTLYRALRVSRGFERQKLGRRQKTAKEQQATAESTRLASEVTALKVSARSEHMLEDLAVTPVARN